MSKSQRPIVYLVDGSSYVFRAFHAIQHLSTSSGVPSNAVFGVTKMLLRLIAEEAPTHLAVIMDKGGKTFRHEMYPEYKAHRPPLPEDLKIQMPLVRRAVQALNLPLLELTGYEGDDILGTLACQAVRDGFDVVLVSADKDLMQLINPHITMFDPMRNMRYLVPGVQEKMGVPPDRVVDLLGLMGDASDNIPGVSGVGEKTAAKLLNEHGDLEAVLAAAVKMKPGKLRDRLMAEAEQARLSKRLATLCLEVPLPVSLDELGMRPPDPQVLDAFLAEFEFTQLRRQLTQTTRAIDTSHYHTVLESKELDKVIERIRATKECALDLETTSLDAMRAQIVGISLCPAEGEAYYIPVGHVGENLPAQLPADNVIAALRPVLVSKDIRWFGQNIKYDSIILKHRHDLSLEHIACDSMLASYVLDPGRKSHGLDNLSSEFLHHQPISYKEVAGKGKQQIPFSQVDLPRATAYSGEDADLTFRLCRLLLGQVDQAGLTPLLNEIELPLSQVLRDMEIAGVAIDQQQLRSMSIELEQQIQQAEQRIYQVAGHPFNINSPTQLRVVLFDELKLDPKKKTKSGASTDFSVLEELALDHDLPLEILNYRSLSKLKSTYVDVLPEMVHSQTGRVHTSFNQAVTATGRLSSSDPNLQNIPIRTEQGRRIREAFVAAEGCQLLSADYSQVELRILAHFTNDEAMLEDFRRGEDVHARTAARIFGVDVAHVTSEMRRRAKAVNFGIIYGQGPFNLAKQLRIPRSEAKDIIDSYQMRHPKVGQWISETHARARAEGFVTTLLGRRRFLPDLHSINHNIRSNAERMAQNTPIQGSAADIIKKAMIDLDRALRQNRLKAQMVLQVHDELVLETPQSELDLVEELVRQNMEGAAALAVPLAVDIGIGRNWAQAH